MKILVVLLNVFYQNSYYLHGFDLGTEQIFLKKDSCQELLSYFAFSDLIISLLIKPPLFWKIIFHSSVKIPFFMIFIFQRHFELKNFPHPQLLILVFPPSNLNQLSGTTHSTLIFIFGFSSYFFDLKTVFLIALQMAPFSIHHQIFFFYSNLFLWIQPF